MFGMTTKSIIYGIINLRFSSNDLEVDNNYQQEINNAWIEKYFHLNYKIVTFKEHDRQERGDKDTFIERLSELSEKVITTMSQNGKIVVEEGEQKTKAVVLLHEELRQSRQMVMKLRTKVSYQTKVVENLQAQVAKWKNNAMKMVVVDVKLLYLLLKTCPTQVGGISMEVENG